MGIVLEAGGSTTGGVPIVEVVGLQGFAQNATNVLTFPITSTVTEGSFRILKGLLAPGRRYMTPDTQIGDLLCMINGDVTRRIPQWARELRRRTKR